MENFDRYAIIDSFHTEKKGLISKDLSILESYGDSIYHLEYTGYIYFSTNNGERRMTYSYENVIRHSDIIKFDELYSEYPLKSMLNGMMKSEKTFLALRYNEEAVEIMTKSVTNFGGWIWIDRNDCDGDPFTPIFK